MPIAFRNPDRGLVLSAIPVDKLVVRTGGRLYREAALSRRTDFAIGRESGQDLVLPGGTVSRKHARIAFRDGAYWVEDLASSNGTCLDHVRVEPGRPSRLWNHSTLRIGHYELRCVFDNATEQAVELTEPGAGPTPASRATTIRIVPTGEEAGTRDTSKEETAILEPLEQRARLVVALRRGYRSYVVAKRRALIGRGGECDIQVPHPTVSTVHAALEALGGRFQLVDLGSSNGIYRASERVEILELRNASSFYLGHALCLFQLPIEDGRPAADSWLDPDREADFGRYLADTGRLAESQLRAALDRERKSGQTLGEVLLFRGILDIEAYAKALRNYEAAIR